MLRYLFRDVQLMLQILPANSKDRHAKSPPPIFGIIVDTVIRTIDIQISIIKKYVDDLFLVTPHDKVPDI